MLISHDGPLSTQAEKGPTELAILDFEIEGAPRALSSMPQASCRIGDGPRTHVTIAASARAIDSQIRFRISGLVRWITHVESQMPEVNLPKPSNREDHDVGDDLGPPSVLQAGQGVPPQSNVLR